MTARVIVTDRDDESRARITDVLRRHGYDAQACADANETIAALGAGSTDAVVADVAVGGTNNGTALAHEVALAHPDLPVIVVTDVRSMTAAMPAMRAAGDLLLKPFHENDLVRAVDMAVRRSGKDVPGGRVHASMPPPPPSAAPPPPDDMPSAAKMPLIELVGAAAPAAAEPAKKRRRKKG
jgi:DNA-binding NtrC family response regulator